MRKLASIVKIASCDHIPDTDRLSVAQMEGKGWKVVTGRDEFKAGDLAVYFEIDSFLNPEDSRFEFLKSRCLKKFVSKSGNVLRTGIRIKTCKLRGVISQGLLMPIDSFPELKIVEDDSGTKMIVGCDADGNSTMTNAVGYDVTSILSVEHYDEVKESLIPICGSNPLSTDAYGPFPSEYIPKTDEERIQNLAEWITKYADRHWEVTAKDDGSSCTMFYSPTIDTANPFGVCSRNLRLKPVTASGIVPAMWLMAKKYLVEEKLKAIYETTGKEFAIQGEFVSPGVQQNRDKYTEPEWHVFRIWDIKNQTFISPDERRKFCTMQSFQHVQPIALNMPVFQVLKSVDEILKFAEGKTARGNEREGVVFKTCDDIEPTLSFKAVSNRYLMKQED